MEIATEAFRQWLSQFHSWDWNSAQWKRNKVRPEGWEEAEVPVPHFPHPENAMQLSR